MKILCVHNKYKQAGGEDQVFGAESKLLEDRGHRALRYQVHNDRVESTNRLLLAKRTVWNSLVYRELRALIRRERPDVAHFHNTLPLISPAGYYAARAEGVPVVQTLHNYRLICPNALLLRDGGVCEDCVGKTVPWPGVVHKCYRGSLPASGVVAAMLATHNVLHTWTTKIDAYIALTDFARDKFIEGGLPGEKITVKPNFLAPDPGVGEGGGGYALFVGRLAPEKGLKTLLAAWPRLGKRLPLKIIGDGPLKPEVVKVAEHHEEIEWLGVQPKSRVLDAMKDAKFLIFPSVWYEGLGIVLLEAYAVGLPVLASRLGSMLSLIDHGRTGRHFRPNDQDDLLTQARWLLSHPAELNSMRREARAEYESKYTAEQNYRVLMGVYESVLHARKETA